jgi:hypothetical protein
MAKTAKTKSVGKSGGTVLRKKVLEVARRVMRKNRDALRKLAK